MKIIDLNGKEITVTDLESSILQVNDYGHYEHINPLYRECDRKQKAYWNDVYQNY